MAYDPNKKTEEFKQEEIIKVEQEPALKETQDGITLQKGDFYSPNFRVGKSGWRFSTDGLAELNNIVLYSNKEDAIIIDHGGDILLKDGGDLKFTTVAEPSACVATLVDTAIGNIDNGTHKYAITFVTASGQTELGTDSNTVTVDATHKQITLSSIPKSTSNAVTARKIYRTKAGGILHYLLATLNDNTTTTYIDNTADADLASNFSDNLQNNTMGKIMVDGTNWINMSRNYVYIGYRSGANNTLGYRNVGLGYNTLYSNTTGYDNVAIGNQAMAANTTGQNNTAVGDSALFTASANYNNTAIGYASLWKTIGNYNCGIGAYSFYNATTSDNNVGIGYYVMGTLTTGDNNTAIGFSSLFTNSTGSGNVALGYYAGYYETGSNAFYIDNQDRTNTAGDKAKALLYGTFNATAASQTLQANAQFKALEVRAISDIGGEASANSLTNVSDLTGNSTGVGTILFKGTTNRNSVGFIKIYIGTTAYYLPVFDAITG